MERNSDSMHSATVIVLLGGQDSNPEVGRIVIEYMADDLQDGIVKSWGELRSRMLTQHQKVPVNVSGRGWGNTWASTRSKGKGDTISAIVDGREG